MQKLGYMPRLDGIRALAVLGVLLIHFIGTPELHWAQTGRIGVRVFFVLSGFLITRILLDYRRQMSVKDAAKAFYWRRFLRLFPAYYLALAVALILGLANVRQEWAWHTLYLSNVLFDVTNDPRHPLGHLWSLAVEEQFYLIWFAVVVWLPRKYLLPAIVAAVLFAPAFRLGSYLLLGRGLSLPFAVMDCLGLGALIGWASANNPRLFRAFGNWPSLAASSGILLSLMTFYPEMIVMGSAMALFGACLVALAATPQAKGLGWLTVKPLLGLGKISYGIYVYHKFLPLIAAHFGLVIGGPIGGVFYICLSVVAAGASWVLIERPALGLKDRFRGGRKPLGELASHPS